MALFVYYLRWVSHGDAKMKWYYVPYRTLKPYRVMGLELSVQVQQSSIHAELGKVEYPLKATVALDNT